jgi:hypothetical protein
MPARQQFLLSPLPLAVSLSCASQVAEFGAPAALLTNERGVLSAMVADTGEATAHFLRSMADGKTRMDALGSGSAQVAAAQPTDAAS